MTSAYVWALITVAIFFCIAILCANMIAYRPNDPGTTKRRSTFWALGVVGVVVGFFINYYFASKIDVPTLNASYTLNSCIAAGISLVVYIILGFALSKMFPRAKVGTWF